MVALLLDAEEGMKQPILPVSHILNFFSGKITNHVATDAQLPCRDAVASDARDMQEPELAMSLILRLNFINLQ